jgi:hypothetical protein
MTTTRGAATTIAALFFVLLAGCGRPAPVKPVADSYSLVLDHDARPVGDGATRNVVITGGSLTVCDPGNLALCQTVSIVSPSAPPTVAPQPTYPACDTAQDNEPCILMPPTPVSSPLPTDAPTAMPMPSVSPTSIPTVVATVAPTATPIPPTTAPTIAPTQTPPSPTPVPTATPTGTPLPTPVPTPPPTARPTTAPTASPRPTPSAPPPVTVTGPNGPIVVGTTATFTVHQGSYTNGFSATSSNTKVATVSVSGASLYVKGLSAGTATITVFGNGGVTTMLLIRK